jgi:hypothetical protein
MAAKRDRFFFLRLGAILALGAVAIAAAELYRRSKRRRPAPPETQRSGLLLVNDILARIASTDFGKSKRGDLLAQTISSFLRRHGVVFTAEIAPQALYRREAGGQELLYIKVLRLGATFAHQSPEGIAEALYHEAVHARKSHYGGSSMEEECDGYAAGLAAGAAIAGRDLPEVLAIDGQPVAAFVARTYPELTRCPTYQPVGQSREWLMRTTGLH